MTACVSMHTPGHWFRVSSSLVNAWRALASGADFSDRRARLQGAEAPRTEPRCGRGRACWALQPRSGPGAPAPPAAPRVSPFSGCFYKTTGSSERLKQLHLCRRRGGNGPAGSPAVQSLRSGLSLHSTDGTAPCTWCRPGPALIAATSRRKTARNKTKMAFPEVVVDTLTRESLSGGYVCTCVTVCD